MEYKAFAFDVAAQDAGVFSGKASVYGIVDLGNDVVMPGAFAESLERTGYEVLVANAHDQKDIVGKATLEDTETALLVKHGVLELELQSARDVHVRMVKGLVKGLSIGYRAEKAKKVGGKRELHKIALHEISPVAFPMLPAARVTAVKAAFDAVAEGLKAGALSAESKAFLEAVYGPDEAERLEAKYLDLSLDARMEKLSRAAAAVFAGASPAAALSCPTPWTRRVFPGYAIVEHDGKTWRVDVDETVDPPVATGAPVEVERREEYVPVAPPAAVAPATFGPLLAAEKLSAMAREAKAYDPNQPRDPGGEGGGQWIDTGRPQTNADRATGERNRREQENRARFGDHRPAEPDEAERTRRNRRTTRELGEAEIAKIPKDPRFAHLPAGLKPNVVWSEFSNAWLVGAKNGRGSVTRHTTVGAALDAYAKRRPAPKKDPA